jgi:ABC-type phosphate transport system substrate-binding protein
MALEVITHPLNNTHSLSVSSLRSIFSMRMTQWPDGTPIRVFVLGDRNPLHAQFSKKILGVFPHQLRRAWNRQIYSGTGQAPAKVESESEMHEMVESTPGAIGYLTEDQDNENVRIIEIE